MFMKSVSVIHVSEVTCNIRITLLLFIYYTVDNAHYVIHRVKNLKCRNSHESVVKLPVVKFEFQ